jgi:glucose 1-dehydrogenase
VRILELALKGRAAVVTGGGKGVGAGISKALASEGVRVLVNYNSNPEMAAKTVEDIIKAGGEAFAYKADVGDRIQVDAMMQKAAEVFGGIDILVNNAAWQPNMDIDEYSEEFYDRIMNINLGGYFRCIQSVLPFLKQSRCPRIINISSVHGKRPGDFDVCYSMTKGGIKMLTREAAIELARYGITVNTIALGAVSIEFKSGFTLPFKTKRKERDRKYTYLPLGRVGTPKDAGNLVLFLASEISGYISGSSIRMDGSSMLL